MHTAELHAGGGHQGLLRSRRAQQRLQRFPNIPFITQEKFSAAVNFAFNGADEIQSRILIGQFISCAAFDTEEGKATHWTPADASSLHSEYQSC